MVSTVFSVTHGIKSHGAKGDSTMASGASFAAAAPRVHGLAIPVAPQGKGAGPFLPCHRQTHPFDNNVERGNGESKA